MQRFVHRGHVVTFSDDFTALFIEPGSGNYPPLHGQLSELVDCLLSNKKLDFENYTTGQVEYTEELQKLLRFGQFTRGTVHYEVYANKELYKFVRGVIVLKQNERVYAETFSIDVENADLSVYRVPKLLLYLTVGKVPESELVQFLNTKLRVFGNGYFIDYTEFKNHELYSWLATVVGDVFDEIRQVIFEVRKTGNVCSGCAYKIDCETLEEGRYGIFECKDRCVYKPLYPFLYAERFSPPQKVKRGNENFHALFLVSKDHKTVVIAKDREIKALYKQYKLASFIADVEELDETSVKVLKNEFSEFLATLKGVQLKRVVANSCEVLVNEERGVYIFRKKEKVVYVFVIRN